MALDHNLLEQYVRALTTRWNRRRQRPTQATQFMHAMNAMHDFITSHDQMEQAAAYARAGLPAPGAQMHMAAPIPGYVPAGIAPPGGYAPPAPAPAGPVPPPPPPMAPGDGKQEEFSRRPPKMDQHGREVVESVPISNPPESTLEAKVRGKGYGDALKKSLEE